jgi:muconolactone delta-isomerase
MRFMVDPHFDPARDAERLALIPQESAYVQPLRDQGLIEALYISAGPPRTWMVLIGESPAEVHARMAAFRIYPYMQKVDITPLR